MLFETCIAINLAYTGASHFECARHANDKRTGRLLTGYLARVSVVYYFTASRIHRAEKSFAFALALYIPLHRSTHIYTYSRGATSDDRHKLPIYGPDRTALCARGRGKWLTENWFTRAARWNTHARKNQAPSEISARSFIADERRVRIYVCERVA